MSAPRRSVDRSSPTIAILGHVGRKNMGDEVILEALIAGLRRTIPGVNLVAFTMNPADTLERHGLATYPIRPTAGPIVHAPKDPPAPTAASRSWRWLAVALKRIGAILWLGRAARRAVKAVRATFREIRFDIASYIRLRHVKLVVIAGSAQVADFFGGPFGFPWALLRWTVLARLGGARVAYVSTGCGPINHPLSRLFLRVALGLSSYRSFRDPSSAELARQALKSPEPNRLVRDLAFSLPELLPRASLSGARTRPVVGINVLPYCSEAYWYVTDESKYQHYLRVHAEAVVRIVERGFDVVLLATQVMDPFVSQRVADLVATLSPATMARVRIPPFVPRVEETLALIRRCDVVVATRYHGLLLSIAQGVPVIGVSYQPKSRDLLAAVGLSDFCVDIDHIEAEQLAVLVDRAWASRAELRQRVIRHLPELRAEVRGQFSELATLANGHWNARPVQRYARKAATVSAALFHWTSHQ
jgi:polysaccharide pyruvyl transferase WcaK-like protein